MEKIYKFQNFKAILFDAIILIFNLKLVLSKFFENSLNKLIFIMPGHFNNSGALREGSGGGSIQSDFKNAVFEIFLIFFILFSFL